MEIRTQFDMLRAGFGAASTFAGRIILFMRNSLICLQRIGTMVGLVFATALVAHAQGGPQNMEGTTAEQAYKNIKVLTGTPAYQLAPAMHLIRAALGVDCEFCHEEADRSADTKRPKE